MGHRADRTDWVSSFFTSAVEWWGESWYEGENLEPRLELVKRYAPQGGTAILELGAGTGETAAYLCDHGYSVTAVDLCEANIALIEKAATARPKLAVRQGDYQTMELVGRFDAVCLFENFGMGNDGQNRRLLARIRDDWLAPSGRIIMDVYNPLLPARKAGTKVELDRLPDVPGSVDMTDYCYFDAIRGRWVDVWEPREDRSKARSQSIRCYTPSDFLLLLEGLGLEVVAMLFGGAEFDFRSEEVCLKTPFGEEDSDYSYAVVLKRADLEVGPGC